MLYNIFIKAEHHKYLEFGLQKSSVQNLANSVEKNENGIMCEGTWIWLENIIQFKIFDNSKMPYILKTDLTQEGRKRKIKYPNGYAYEIELLMEMGNEITVEFEKSAEENQVIDTWLNIHPVIIKVSKKKYEDHHFADAIKSAFKEINDIVKKEYKKIKKSEPDGDSLMRQAFSVNNPVFKLADQSSETGRNIQQGYMDIFAGSMKGIRNPKAHENFDVHPDEAWEMIVLASHLMRMWYKRII